MRCRLKFIFLPMDVQSFWHQLLKFSYIEFLWYLVEISQAYLCGSISGFSILFHWSMHLSLCQYHTVLVIVTIILKVGRVGHNWATFSLQIVQTWAFLCFTALICNWHSAQLSCVPTVLFSLRHNSLHPAFLSLIPCFFPLFHSMWLYIFSSSFSSVGLLWWLSVKESSCQCRGCSFNLWVENPLQKEMATHSIILAWRIPWTEESGGLQPMGVAKSQTWLKWLACTHRDLTSK